MWAKISSRIIKPEALFFVLVWFGLQYYFQYRAFDDPGALWHTRVGEIILRDGFMTTDPFTFTFAGQTWIPQQWIGEVMMALAHRWAGLDAMLAGFSAGVAGMYTWIFSRAIRNGMHPALAAVIVGGAGTVGAFHFYARPHMATILGMAIVMAWLIDFERGRAGLWRMWWLIPLCVFWTNIHGGVLGGVATMGFAVLGWGVVYWWNRRNSGLTPTARQMQTPINSYRQWAILAIIVGTCVITPLVNPFGLEMIHTWKKIVGSSAMKEFVTEHHPLSLDHTAGQVVVGLGLFYAVMFAGTLPRVPRVTWILPFIWFLLSVQSIRQGPLFAVIAVMAIVDFWPETIWYRLLQKYGDSLALEVSPRSRGWAWTAIPVCVLVAVLTMQRLDVKAPIVGTGWADLGTDLQPIELREKLREYARTAPPGTAIYNDANLGGFVIYYAPQLKVYMDDRFELYGDAFLRDYIKLCNIDPQRIEDLADQYRFDMAFIVVEPERLKLDIYLSTSPRWVEVARCKTGALYRRQESVTVGLAK